MFGPKIECPNCGCKMMQNASYCPRCGTEMEKQTSTRKGSDPIAEEMLDVHTVVKLRCKGCGRLFDRTSGRCLYCGTSA